MMHTNAARILAWIGLSGSVARAITLDVTSEQSILAANTQACDNALTFYGGDRPGGTPGIPNPPYFWWEAGGLFGLLIQRWSITGNDSLNDMITQGLQFQVGANQDYQPANQSFDLGNDDQAYWGMAALDAAELNFPAPPAGDPSWLALAQAVFNRQTARWETEHCNGGMRWQVNQITGYDYKNVASNGAYAFMGARLARYTGNNSYLTYVERTYDWMASSAIFDNTTQGLQIWDGVATSNCAPSQKFWSYNPAVLIVTAAYLYNYTNGSALWEQRIRNLLYSLDVYFVDPVHEQVGNLTQYQNGSILAEIACESWNPQSCNNDEPSFKAYTSRWLALTTVMAPFTNESIWPRLVASAQGAAGQCIGTAVNQTAGTACGRRWYQSTWDGFSGMGEQMSAMSVFQNLLIHNAKSPLTAFTGGTSKSDPGAGLGDDTYVDPWATFDVTTGQKVGASIVTIVSVALCIGTSSWMMMK